MEAVNSRSTYDLDNSKTYSERGLILLSSTPSEKQYPFLRFGFHHKYATQDLQCINMANMDMTECDKQNGLIRSIIIDGKLQTQAVKSAETSEQNVLQTRFISKNDRNFYDYLFTSSPISNSNKNVKWNFRAVARIFPLCNLQP